jgi:membrane-associated protease RseP (regulator of RpoE activity)
MDQFVRVRAVQMHGVDLSLFQFQGQLTWAAVFLNADGTIYGRYGSRGARRGMRENDEDISLDGFQKAVEGALDLHGAYPANRASLAGKRGPAPLARTPERLPAAPSEEARPARSGEHGCVHCHMVDDWQVLSVWKSSKPVPDKLLFPYPMPDALGLALDVKERAAVTSVAGGSAAQRAGFQPGDRIVSIEGQPIISIADVQWVLHQAPEPSTVKAEVDRSGSRVNLDLAVSEGWRRSMDLANTVSVGWFLRSHLVGMRCEALSPDAKRRLGLAEDALALRIAEIPGWVKHHAARKIGLKKDDVITGVDGRKTSLTEAELLSYLAQKKAPGQKVDLEYLRDGKPRTAQLDLP